MTYQVPDWLRQLESSGQRAPGDRPRQDRQLEQVQGPGSGARAHWGGQ